MDKYSGPRAMAMGGAFVAVADDLNAPYWNPAGLARASSSQFGTTYVNLFEMVDRLSFDGIVKIKNTGLALGINYVQESMQGLQETVDVGGNGIQVGSFNEYKRAANIGLAWKQSARTYAGINARLLYNSLADDLALGGSFDAGFLWNIKDSLYFGLVAKNVMSKLEWSTSRVEYFERKLLTGVAVTEKMLDITTVLALDYEINAFSHNRWFAGAELWLAEDSFAFRFGTNSDKQWTFGTGLRYSNFMCDFCYREQEFLGAEYLLSLGYDFDPAANKSSRSNKNSGQVQLASAELQPGDPLVITVRDPDKQYTRVAISFFNDDKIRKIPKTKQGFKITRYFKDPPPLNQTQTAKVYLQDAEGTVTVEHLQYKYVPEPVTPKISLLKNNWYRGQALEIKMQVPKGTKVETAVVELDEFHVLDMQETSPGIYLLKYPLSQKLKYGTYSARALIKISGQPIYKEKIIFRVVKRP